MFRKLTSGLMLAVAINALSGSGDTYLSRGVTGGALGACSGAAIGAVTGVGAGKGALIGGGVGAVTRIVTK